MIMQHRNLKLHNEEHKNNVEKQRREIHKKILNKNGGTILKSE